MADILNQWIQDTHYNVTGENKNPAIRYKIIDYSFTPIDNTNYLSYSITLNVYMNNGGYMGAYKDNDTTQPLYLTFSLYAGTNNQYCVCSHYPIKMIYDTWSSSSDTSPITIPQSYKIIGTSGEQGFSTADEFELYYPDYRQGDNTIYYAKDVISNTFTLVKDVIMDENGNTPQAWAAMDLVHVESDQT